MKGARDFAQALAAVIVVLLAAPIAASGAPSHGRLELSLDGRRWSSNLRTPLFDPAVRWVPGDSRSADLWVKNGSSDRGRLVVSVQGTRLDSLLESGALTITARCEPRCEHSWSRPVHEGGTQELLRVGALAPGHRIRIVVGVALDGSAINATQAKGLKLAFRVRLQQLVRRPHHDHGEPQRNGPSPWWVALSAGPAGVGAAIYPTLNKTRRPTTRRLLARLQRGKKHD